MRQTHLKALKFIRNEWALVKRRAERRIKGEYVSARKGLNDVYTYIRTLKVLEKERN